MPAKEESGETIVSGVPLQTVLEAFGLGKALEALPTRGGLVSNAVIVRSPQGWWVVKERPPWLLTPERTAFEEELFARLQEAGLPFAKRRRTTTGSPSAEIAGKSFDVYEFVKGRPYSPRNEAHLMLAAETLARLHTAMEAIPADRYPSVHSLNLTEIQGEFRETLRFLLVESTAATKTGSSRARRLKQMLDGIQERFGALVATVAPVLSGRELAPEVIHGDYGPEQLLYDNSRVAAVLDFDASGVGDRAFDLAHSLIGFAARTGRALLPRTYSDILSARHVDMKAAALFVCSYCKVVPVTDQELALVVKLTGCLWIRSVMWVSRWDEEHDLAAILRKGGALLDWLQRNEDELLQILLAAVK